ncbi:MAG TPA: thiamine pyrophosphate-binding protein [Solirubrobacterales bacterium]
MSARAPGSGPVTVAEAMVATLERLGVQIAFGLPGVHNLPLWDALRNSGIRLVGVRHEQTTVYAADGHARLTGELGVAITTTGPGAANAVAACGEAWAGRSPLLVIATDIPASLRRAGVYRGVLHETRDQARMFETVVKGTYRIDDPEAAASTLAAAAARALEGTPGPTYLEIPTDLLRSATDPSEPPEPAAERRQALPAEIERAATALDDARDPLIWVGRGAIEAGEQVERLAIRLGAPVIETFGARGLVSAGHPSRTTHSPHFPEIGGLWDDADAVLAVGTDFDGTMTQNWAMPQPRLLVSNNLSATEAAKAYRPDVLLLGDAATTLEQLADELDRRGAAAPGLSAWPDVAVAERLRRTEPEATAFLADLESAVPAATPVVVDMCVAGYWIGAARAFAAPRLLAYPIGWGTLGFGFPAAIGTALSHQAPTLCVCGDGGFLFAAGELATLAEQGAPLTVLIVDDGGYGMLRFDQRQAGEEPFGVDLVGPDFVALARSFGIDAELVADIGEPLRDALRRSVSAGRPRVLVLRKTFNPPESTSPRWYRRRHN